MSQDTAKNEILLETGTNELEILEFLIAGNSFGINVSKINKLNQALPVQPMPRSHPFIEGVFHVREDVFTLVNLPGYLGLPPSDKPENDIFIVAGFNQISIAFRVDRVENIHRISWTAINKPDVTIYGGQEGIVTGITKIGDRIISIIDFEKIVFDISPESGIQMSEIEGLSERDRIDIPLLVAEDSELLRRMILEALHKAGYQKVTICDNGQEAWDMLLEFKSNPVTLFSNVALIITDIEMPQMDGHRLTKLIKDDPVLSSLPVIIFSSLIDEAMRIKGDSVGANAQLSKPEIGQLVSLIDSFLGIVPDEQAANA
jgi:two-component system chemotaxis response regulator CheV